MSLLIRGDLVKLELEDEQILDIPEYWGLVHDVDGKLLGRCELVICPYELVSENIEGLPQNVVKAAVSYYGGGKRLVKGSVEIPNGPWQFIGDAVFIYYARYGKKRGLYQHPFEEPVPVFQQKYGECFKLKLPNKCIIDSRGFVWP